MIPQSSKKAFGCVLSCEKCVCTAFKCGVGIQMGVKDEKLNFSCQP